jgi:phosphohistidine phosphatase
MVPMSTPRTLLVLRHAKSDWAGDHADVDRPLTTRGRTTARLMGRFISASRQEPDVVICSPAVRAQRTLELAMEAGRWHCPVRTAEALYGDGVAAVLNELRKVDDEDETVMVVGHQPTWQDLVQTSVGGGRLGFPTACLARVDFDVPRWNDVQPGEGVLTALVPPKLFSEDAFE